MASVTGNGTPVGLNGQRSAQNRGYNYNAKAFPAHGVVKEGLSGNPSVLPGLEILHERNCMPNIGTVLKEEIVRLSRKESRLHADPVKKTATQLRHDVAALKRELAQLQRQVAMLSRKVLGRPPAPDSEDANAKPTRFSAKGLQAQRSRIALSANDFGKLMGVSAQSIYNWESEMARPRPEQIAKLVALRALGKREIAARLDQLAGAKS